jgi:hypothetical protein
MYEHHRQPLIPAQQFLYRLAFSSLFVCVILGVSLGIGVWGYHYIAQLGWVDSLLNASMILTGMGPVNKLQGNTAKIFASVYALFSGVIFLTSASIIIAPIFHRFLHQFHLDFEESQNKRRKRKSR